MRKGRLQPHSHFRLVTALLGSLLLAACDKPVPPEKPVRPVLTQVVELEQLWDEMSFSGDVRARYDTSRGFRIGGKIIERPVDVGDRVKAGTLMARLDPQDSELATLNAKAQVAAARADFDKAKADLDRYRSLLSKKYISQAEFTKFKNLFNVAEARLEQSQAELAVTRNKGKYTELRSDRDGVITTVAAEVGQVVASGQTVVKLALSNEKEVVIAVPENRLDKLGGAQEVRVELWAVPGATFNGSIREISPGADPVTRTYAVRIRILTDDPRIQLGMTATTSFLREIPGDMAKLPLTSLYQEQGHNAVWLVDRDSGKVKLREIEIAEYHENSLIVRSGLKPGEIVVTAGVHKLAPGQQVRIASNGFDTKIKTRPDHP